MRILILGGSGMFGHRLSLQARAANEVWVSMRGTAAELPQWLRGENLRVLEHVDAMNVEDMAGALAEARPHVVINCIGIVKQLPLAKNPLPMLMINAVFPHRLALLCRAGGIRLVHISTDCVFSGTKGNYVEADVADATDLYGRCKFLGELHYPHTLTLRTSIIGRELKTRVGLVEWFLSQSGNVKGFTKAIYSGFSADELARILLLRVLPNDSLHGLYHVASLPISKYDLLCMLNDRFQKCVTIDPDVAFACDRSLNADRFNAQTGYRPPAWISMIEEFAATSGRYDKK